MIDGQVSFASNKLRRLLSRSDAFTNSWVNMLSMTRPSWVRDITRRDTFTASRLENSAVTSVSSTTMILCDYICNTMLVSSALSENVLWNRDCWRIMKSQNSHSYECRKATYSKHSMGIKSCLRIPDAFCYHQIGPDSGCLTWNSDTWQNTRSMNAIVFYAALQLNYLQIVSSHPRSVHTLR